MPDTRIADNATTSSALMIAAPCCRARDDALRAFRVADARERAGACG
jgi:hypothetical protein